MDLEDFQFIKEALKPFDLQTAPVDLVSRLLLSERSKLFLNQVGLPAREVVPGAVFDELRTTPTLREYYGEEDYQFGGPWDQTRLLGEQNGIATYINLADGGSVWQFRPGRPPTILFVNSNVELLGGFLAEFARPRNGWGNWDQGELETAEARLRALDPPALDDRQETYWPLVFEDARLFW